MVVAFFLTTVAIFTVIYGLSAVRVNARSQNQTSRRAR